MESRKIVSVRPTKDGKWEAVKTTVAEDRRWQKEWATWYKNVGEHLKAENPDYWKER